jgi:hypothetical protein
MAEELFGHRSLAGNLPLQFSDRLLRDRATQEDRAAGAGEESDDKTAGATAIVGDPAIPGRGYLISSLVFRSICPTHGARFPASGTGSPWG